ncbi:MAG: hypothetical protein A3B23_02170 [Candidatus Colwellbacteria bacterium RIFCSPLOWO2_01_FULL_48_10]|uniref:Damage-inducible protein J n=1 Tax=Candidatus Colwellbacteria bacterium RIFCSPLOWO2_01_FULL_48_10 TaxID=1797690 RepID=A0A1G1Z5X5_9BACT|nr:MAG: hypothetical protein A3B23_02170 [Candidatus Colwellbacteria bacterium RIFCSPLOWO2_01_FULL_48_10]
MKTTTSVKIDKNIKEEAAKLASEMGLNLSSVINATLKKFVDERRVVFNVSPEFNVETEKEFAKIREEIKNRRNVVGPFNTVRDLKRALLD